MDILDNHFRCGCLCSLVLFLQAKGFSRNVQRQVSFIFSECLPSFHHLSVLFSVARFNRTNELFCKPPPQDEGQPTPLPRYTTNATAPTVNTLNRGSEIVTGDFNYYQSATALNITHSETDGFSDDENGELDDVNISNDPHQRLIM